MKQIKKIFYSPIFTNILFYLFIVSLALGKFIAELNLLFFFIIFIIHLISKKSNLQYNNAFLFFLIFYLYISINSLIQIESRLVWSSFGYIRFIILAYLIYFFLKQEFFYSKKILFSLIIFFIFLIFDSIFQFYTGKNFFNYELVGDRVSGIFADELILGSYTLKSFFIILSLIFINQVNLQNNKYKMIFLFVLTYFCIYISAERTAFIMMLISIILLFYYIKSLREIIKVSFFIFFFIIILISNLNLGQKTNPNAMLVYKTFNQITNYSFAGTTPNRWLSKDFDNLNFESKIKNISEIKIFFISQDHYGHYELAKYLFQKNKLFGSGPRGFREFCNNVNYNPPVGTCTTHPHNFFIQVMSELGIIGLIFYFLGFFFLFFYILLKTLNLKNNLNNKNIILILLISIFVNFFPFAPSGDFYNQYHSFFNFLNFGLLIFFIEKEKLIKNRILSF